MSVEVKSGLEVLWASCQNTKLTTGNIELDNLLSGGIERGLFHLFYGDKESSVDYLLHRILINSLLSVEKGGWNCKAIYLNCGNYKYERTLLDIKLLTQMARLHQLDVSRALDRIYALPVYSEEQEEYSVGKIAELLELDREVKLVIAHNIAKLFVTGTWSRDKDVKGKILRLQGVVGRINQACCDNGASLVASCRPLDTHGLMSPPPEGGRYLRHLVNVMVHFQRVGKTKPFISAVLLKHPSRPPKRTNLNSMLDVKRGGHL